jgi:hypothetical protein
MNSASQAPLLRVAVCIERERAPNRWEDWRFRITEVLTDQSALQRLGDTPRLLREDTRFSTTLHPGLEVRLHRDEAEGYWLNLTSGQPVWFVMWRVDDADSSRAWPECVTLSYHEAGRMLDAQERVDNLPLPAEVCQWLQAYTDEHYRPEPKQRRRPASFKPVSQR